MSTALNQNSAVHDETAISANPLQPPTLEITSGRGQLLIRGMTLSEEHEAALLRLAADHFDGFDTRIDFSAGVILDREWEASSNLLLYTIAALDSGEAIMRDGSISIRGVTSDKEIYATRHELLRKKLPDGFVIDADVLAIEQASAANEHCETVFSHLIAEPIAFRESSDVIRSASLVALDRITEFALACQHTTIAITGHTDGSGDESWNRRLSLLRAQAVADHLIDRGVDPARLIVAGLGSAEPVADNDTARGRELNRRIEFALQ